jgi:hypothetical protein
MCTTMTRPQVPEPSGRSEKFKNPFPARLTEAPVEGSHAAMELSPRAEFSLFCAHR